MIFEYQAIETRWKGILWSGEVLHKEKCYSVLLYWFAHPISWCGVTDVLAILGLQARDKAAMLVVNKFFFQNLHEFSSQRREILLFLFTNMNTVTSRPNQQ